MKGYRLESSDTWHTFPFCQGFGSNERVEMPLEEAKSEGLRPCRICTDGEWPEEQPAEA